MFTEQSVFKLGLGNYTDASRTTFISDDKQEDRVKVS